MWPIAVTIRPMARPCARAIPRSPGPPVPWRNCSAQMEPAPKKMSANVPTNSAASFWGMLYMGEASNEQGCGSCLVRALREFYRIGLRQSKTRAANRAEQCQLSSLDGELAGAGGDGNVAGRQPVVAVRFCSSGEGVKLFLEAFCDGAWLALADGDAVHGANGADFHGGARKKDFIGDVEHLAGNHLLLHGNAEVFAERHHAGTRDAREDAGGKRRRVNGPIVHEKNVHPGAFAQVAGRVEGDALGVVVEGGFHADELRVHVVRGGFGHGRQSVWRDARPGADANLYAFSVGILAEIRTPRPASHVALDGRGERIDAGVTVAAQNDGLDAAGIEFVAAHELGGDVAELFHRIGQLHA